MSQKYASKDHSLRRKLNKRRTVARPVNDPEANERQPRSKQICNSPKHDKRFTLNTVRKISHRYQEKT
jgi:hypothetical protein